MKKPVRKKILLMLITFGILVLLSVGAYYYYMRKQAEANTSAAATTKAESDRTYKVRRDDLPIGLLQGGYVNASQKHKLSLQANFNTKLLWVIEENSWVKAGDVLVKFEVDELKKRIEDFEIELDNLVKELEIAVEAEKILVSSNAAELQSAEDKLQQCNDAMKKYRRFERSRTVNTHETKIADAEAAYSAANEAYRKKRDEQLGNDEQNESAEEKRRKELAKLQTDINAKYNALDNTEGDRRVWRRYDHPTKMTRLANDLEQAELSLRRVRISVNSKVIQQKRSIENYKKRIEMTTTQLTRHREYMEMMTIVSPVDGVVIYSDPDRSWGRLDVKAGIDIGKGQVIITIPEMSNLIVEFDLPEQYRSKVKVGDNAILLPDSLPGEKFSGKVSSIATLPVNIVQWDSASPKVYKSKIKLDEQSSKLVNGMSVQINIVTKILPQTIFVPVEAVFEDNDRFFVFRNTLAGVSETDVKIGDSNDNFVEILEGLDEGDVVYLYRPYQKKQDEK